MASLTTAMATSLSYWRSVMRASSSKITLTTSLGSQQSRTLAAQATSRTKPPQIERAIRLRESQKRRERRSNESSDEHSFRRHRREEVATTSEFKWSSDAHSQDVRNTPASRSRYDWNDAARGRSKEDESTSGSPYRDKLKDSAKRREAAYRDRKDEDVPLREKRWRIAQQLRELNYDNDSHDALNAFVQAEAIFEQLPPILRRTIFVYVAMIRHALNAGRTHRALQLVQLMRKDGIAPSLEVYQIIFTGMRELKVSADVNVALVRAARAMYDDLEALLDERSAMERTHGRDEARNQLKAEIHPQGYDGAVPLNTAESYRNSRRRTLLETFDRADKLLLTRCHYAFFLESAGLAEEANVLHDELRSLYPDYDETATRIRSSLHKKKLFRSAEAAKPRRLDDDTYEEYLFLQRGAVGAKPDKADGGRGDRHGMRNRRLALSKDDMQDILSSGEDDVGSDEAHGGPASVHEYMLERRVKESTSKEQSKSSVGDSQQ